jgi:hypothetical protein
MNDTQTMEKGRGVPRDDHAKLFPRHFCSFEYFGQSTPCTLWLAILFTQRQGPGLPLCTEDDKCEKAKCHDNGNELEPFCMMGVVTPGQKQKERSRDSTRTDEALEALDPALAGVFFQSGTLLVVHCNASLLFISCDSRFMSDIPVFTQFNKPPCAIMRTW